SRRTPTASCDDRVVEDGKIRVRGRRRHVVDDLRAWRRGVRVLHVERDLGRKTGTVGAARGSGRTAGADLRAARGKRRESEQSIEGGDVRRAPGVETHDGNRLPAPIVAGGAVVEARELRRAEGTARIAGRLARGEGRLHVAGAPEGESADDELGEVRRQRRLLER